MPANYDLGRGFLVLRRDADNDGIAQQLPAAKRTPGFRSDPMLVMESAPRSLLESRMKLDLIDQRLNPRFSDDPSR
jgi:hypothetical protein